MRTRNKKGQFKSIIVEVKCDVGYPCDLTIVKSNCVNRFRCIRNNEIGLKTELERDKEK